MEVLFFIKLKDNTEADNFTFKSDSSKTSKIQSSPEKSTSKSLKSNNGIGFILSNFLKSKETLINFINPFTFNLEYTEIREEPS